MSTTSSKASAACWRSRRRREGGADAARGANIAIYNIGNNRPTTVNDFIATLERILGRKAIRNEMPIQPGDVPVTCASIERLQAATGFAPVTPLEEGLAAFCDWFRTYRGM